MENPEIRFHKPCAALQPYVRYIYELRSRSGFRTLTFPLGSPQIIFHRQTPLFIPELNRRQAAFTISGQVNFPAHVCTDGDTEMLVAVFQPYSAGMFIGTPPSELYNLEISGHDIGNRELDELAARITDCADNALNARAIEHYLLGRLHDAPSPSGLARIGAATRRMMEHPATTVTQLADAACLSRRHFGRLFSSHVGMSPKEYARVVRFQKSLWLMQNGRGAGAAMAYDCGYADQSHFIREFKAFSGHTPDRLRECCRPYSDLFTAPV